MAEKNWHAKSSEFLALAPEKRLALLDAGKVVGDETKRPDEGPTFRGEKELSDEQIQHMRGLERERELLQSLGRDLHPRLRMELGDLQDTHKRTAPNVALAQKAAPTATDRAREALERALEAAEEAAEFETAGTLRLAFDKLDKPRT